MIFNVRKDAVIRARSLITNEFRNYSIEDVGRIIAYFVDKLNSLTHQERIGVVGHNISLLSVCFMLALQKYNREFTMIYDNDMDFEFKKTFCSHLFIVGWIGTPHRSKVQALDREQFTLIDTAEVEQAALAYPEVDNLEFNFDDDRKTYIVYKDEMSLLYPNGKIEAGSISAAIKNYFNPDDVCILHRPFQHLGVATLSIYPALFSSRDIIICSNKDDWNSEYTRATNVHMSKEMILDDFPLPEKLRIITTGGYNFNSECVDFVTKKSTLEKIVDCYGTRLLPPPMAIRTLEKPNTHSMWTPFNWVHEYVTPTFDHTSSKLIFSTVDGDDIFNFAKCPETGKFVSLDIFRYVDEKSFDLLGSVTDFIRMSHVRYSISDFIQLFSQRTGISNLSVEFEIIDGLKNPIVLVDHDQLETAINAGKKYSVESKIKAR